MELRMLKTKLVSVEEMSLIQELYTYELPLRVYDYYIKNIKGNSDVSVQNCKKKLIRNILLSYQAPTKEGLEHKITYYYGCLIIQLNMIEKSICYIQNKLDNKHTYKIDMQKRSALDYIMGIED